MTFSAATPAAHNTTADLSTAAVSANEAQPADGFSAAAYCAVGVTGFLGGNSKRYGLVVYFRQSDRAPLNVSLLDVSSGAALWSPFLNNSGNPITGVAVNASPRTIVFTSTVLAGAFGEAVTISGTASYPASTTAACGS